MKTAPSTGRGRRAFTLLELLLATAIFAIVLVAINTVFYSALRLRDRTTAALAAELPVNQAMAVMRRDLAGTLPPGGTLAGDFKSGTGSSSVGNRNSSSGGTTGAAMAQGSTLSAAEVGSLDFFTTGGALSETEPFGDVQEVNYQLVAPADPLRALGRDLVRTVNRNLLAISTPASQSQRLLGNVARLEFLFYDGSQWRNSWDTSNGDTNLPLAVRVRLLLARENPGANDFNRQPMELLVPLVIQSGTNTTAATNTTSG
jgi:prepilin-type N-terminal cleavage/methylation domain-containing protein